MRTRLIPVLLCVFLVFAFLGCLAGLRIAGAAAPGEEAAPEVEEPERVRESGLYGLRKQPLPAVICCGSGEYAGREDMERAVGRMAREYEGRALALYVDMAADPSEGLFAPVSPTLIFIGAEGRPYVPSEAVDLKYGFQLKSDPISGRPLYTYHLGSLNRWDLRAIINDMLGQKEGQTSPGP